jgi:hypothetical protein
MSQVITRQLVADKLAAYLQHDLSLTDLVDWAEYAIMDGEFERQHLSAIRDVVARLGLADIRAFGLTWEDCEELLKRLGYAAHVQIMAT